jgi:phosphocarrier protein HPr
MNETEQTFSIDVTVVNDLGLHARSASKIAELAMQATAKVWVQRNEERVDAGSILDILTLACEKGSKLTILIEDKADITILNRIVDLVKNGFGE